ncbi:MAG: ferredoxin family protein, partial [Armatimonadota bacterium]|nr:ferredoxin family protein [Armatimonadota bacterium]
MGRIVINSERCKGCELCINFCPKNLIYLAEHFNSKGFHPAVFKDSGECTGCTACAVMCPDVAIDVY